MDGIELMATALHAAQERVDVSAANLANAGSTGFRRRILRASLTPRGLVTTRAFDRARGPLHRTGRALDVAVAGDGAFFVRDRAGRALATRSASFVRDGAGRFVDASGNALLGASGDVVAGPEATIDANGRVREGGRVTAALRAMPGTTLRRGFLEAPNVDAVREMVDLLGAERAFETAQKTLVAIDETRAKSADDVARVKA